MDVPVVQASHAEFTALVGPFVDRMYTLALRLSGDRTQAEDVLQDALLRAYRSLGQLRQPERAWPWLVSVVRSAWLDGLRKDPERERALSIDDERFSLFDTLVEEDPFPYSDRLHLDFLEMFDDERFTAALRGIHPPNREALVLAYVYGYKAREIAELTGTTVGTVLARLHRARKQLERSLWAYATERGLLEKGVVR